MKKKEKEGFALRKVHLESFISVLLEAFENGADFIDITVFPDGIQDVIQIEVKEEYLCPDTEDAPLTNEIIKKLMI